ncbi:MAG: hypothetical protein HS117_02380 [Verrucomicrobiaceae bacterium]|nr:hypothetical protein [Verrucomicrobiaceae bacterium]
MTALTKITLDKREVAKRQLNAAINLWFDDGEPIAVHTLACAAHELLASLLQKAGKKPLMFDASLYQPGYAEEARRMWKKHYNFFKHADRDPDSLIEFPTAVTDIFLLMAVEGWRELVGEREPIHFAFWAWCVIRFPNLMQMKDAEGERMLFEVKKDPLNLKTVPKSLFRKLFVSAFDQFSRNPSKT